jgi:prepilin-type processing-associated H-X9-DG protein
MTEFEKLLLNEQLKQMMSQNHQGRGQNILYCDGSVKYIRERVLNGDDIFTVNGVDAYTGREVPADQNDTFLAP